MKNLYKFEVEGKSCEHLCGRLVMWAQKVKLLSWVPMAYAFL